MTESGKLPGGGDVGSGLCRGRIWIGRYAGDVGWRDSEAAATPSYNSRGLLITMELECLVKMKKPRPPVNCLSSKELLRGNC